MAVIEVSPILFKKLINRDIAELEEVFMNLKCELEISDKVKVEIKDFYRPDLYSIAGIVREIKGFLGIETGIPKFKINHGNYEIYVDKELENIRPYIVSAVIENINLDDDILSDLIQFQEKVTQSFGRNRKKIAIGIHNKDLIKFPVYYKAVKPNEIKFIPLKSNKEMNLIQILDETETGKKYRHLVEKFDKFPILVDSRGKVISFPPIINSNDIGNVTPKTKSIFLDITGDDLEILLLTLNFFVLNILEYGGELYSVKIIYPDFEIITPKLEIIRKTFDLNKVKGIVGEIDEKNIIELLKRARMNAYIENNKLIVEYLNYRKDIISEQDIAEEILMRYGYNKIKPTMNFSYTKGKLSKRRKLINYVRELFVSLGAIEIYTPTLTSKDINDLIDFKGKSIELLNYVSTNYNSIRKSLLSSFLQLLSSSLELEFPAKIFEIGRIAYLDDSKVIEEDRVLYIYSDYSINFNNAKSVLERIFHELNVNYDISESNYKFLIEGRQGNILFKDKIVGWIGEINPFILEKLNIKYPLVGFEIGLDILKEIKDDI